MSFAQKRKFEHSTGNDSRKFQRSNDHGDNNRAESGPKLKSKKDFMDYEKLPYETVLRQLPDDYNAEKTSATTTLKNAQNTKDLRHFNRLIGDLGNTRNMYSYAIRAFQGIAEAKLTPNKYTYNALINAAGRAADLEQGLQWFRECKDKLGESAVDEIMMTTVIKLCCYSGDLKKAIQYFKELYHHPTLSPTIRTYNTIIRQCFMDNAVSEAEEIYSMLQQHIAQQSSPSATSPAPKPAEKPSLPKNRKNFDDSDSDSDSSDSDSDSDSDSSSSESEEEDLSKRESPNTTTPEPTTPTKSTEPIIMSSSILEFMARLYAMNFEIPTAMKYFDQLQELQNDKTQRDTRYDAALIPYTYISAGIAITQGCVALNDLRTARRIFLLVKDILDKISKSNRPEWKSTYVHPNQRHDKNEPKPDESEEPVHRVAFEHDGDFTQQQFMTQRANESKNALFDIDKYLTATALFQNTSIQALQRNERLAQLSWKPTTATTKTNGLTASHRVLRVDTFKAALDNKNKQCVEQFTKDVLDSKGKIDFQKIFKNKNPIVMEVGSGTGEWLMHKAQLHPDLNFVAAEIMPTRVYEIYSRMLLSGIKNVVILQGDAIFTMNELVGTKSLHQIYVNFPEPPWWSQWRYKLFTPAFFAACHQSLVKSKLVVDNQDLTDDKSGMNGQGTLTIVTDDSYLTYQLHRTIFHENGDVYNLFASFLADQEGKSVCFHTQLPASYGSSYYHRFWKRGAKFRRFYLKMGKNNNVSNAKEFCEEIQTIKASKPAPQRQVKQEKPPQPKATQKSGKQNPRKQKGKE